MGVTYDGEGVNVAVFSDHARCIELCLFEPGRSTESHRLVLPEREGGIWYGYVPGLVPGQLYGLRAHGEHAPRKGHRFNPHKLLIDPYARQLTGHPEWHDALMGYTPGGAGADLSFDSRDSAPYMPRCVIQPPPPPPPRPEERPATPLDRTVIYETHVRGLTKRLPGADAPGTFRALGDPRVIEHLKELGVTAVELLPVHAFLDDRFLVRRGLRNYWGYQTIGFFAPEPRYLARGAIGEVRATVDALHAAGLEVILDVVYNHTGEGNELGPTLSFRGLDNASYYRLPHHDRATYINDTGTGNTLDTEHPMVLRMVMDSLRYWVQAMGVDGFRFDLAATLGRTAHGFDPRAPLLDAIRQDPVLVQTKLIAEPWDIGPGGYQLGAFPPPFAEWNDKFRDDARRFWRGDAGAAPEMAKRLTGSARQFDHSGRRATSSVNFLSAHDGFTLHDLTAYSQRHNAANGEGGHDGHGENHSDNMGHEGPTGDTAILSARAARARAMLASLFLSQGTPMLLGGDEIGRTQGGNNNAYCQDNETSWYDWARADLELMAFVRRLAAFRAAEPALRQGRFLHGEPRHDGYVDLVWHSASGGPMAPEDWSDPSLCCLCLEIRQAAGLKAAGEEEGRPVFLVFNSGPACTVSLPPGHGLGWERAIDSAAPEAAPILEDGPKADIAAQSCVAFALGPARTA